MRFWFYFLVVLFFLSRVESSYSQVVDSIEYDTAEIDSEDYELSFLENPFKHKNNTWVNVPQGYIAVDSTASNQILDIYGISLNGNADLVTIMVPESGTYSTDEPFIVVLYYPGFIPTKVTLNKVDKEDIYNALTTEKNTRADVRWLFNDWIIDDTKFDRKRNLFKMNAFYKFDGNFQFAQRQIAYWQFGNKGTYHYVWICPEDKISLFQPPRSELDNLLGVLPSFNYSKRDENFPYSDNLSLEDLICMEDLGPTEGKYDDESEVEESDVDVATDRGPEPAPVVFGLPALFMFLGQLSWYQLGGLIGVPIITTLFIFLFNNKAGKRQKKDIPWD